MKLRSILSLQSIERLCKIASLGELPVEPGSNKTVLIDLLCKSLSDPRQIRLRYESLDSSQQDLVNHLASEGGELLKSDAVEEFASGLTRRFQKRFDAISATGLAFEESETLGKDHPVVGIPDPILKSISIPTEMVGNLRSIMRYPSIGLLRTFARDLGALPDDSRRPFVVRAIRMHLLDTRNLNAFMNGLSEDKRTILDLFLREGQVSQAYIREHIGETAIRDLDELLYKTPLFYHNDDRVQSDTPIRVALDLGRAMAELAEERGGKLESHSGEVLELEPDAPTDVMDNTQYILQDLATLLGFVELRAPRKLKHGGIAKAEIRDAKQFYRGDDDPGYSEFLVLFAETAGLLKTEGRVWRVNKGAPARLEKGPDIHRALLSFWQETERWNEWSIDRAASGSRKRRMAELKTFRREVLAGLLSCPEGRWISYHQFYSLLIKSSESFKYLAEHPDTGRALSSGGTTADELLRRMLRGVLTWIGLIRLGDPGQFTMPIHQESRATFQIYAESKPLLEGKSAETKINSQTNEGARFVLQPNLEVLSPPDLRFAKYIKLCGIAEVQAIDVMTRFQISRESLQGAMNRGSTGKQIREFLRKNSATGLPEMVDALIKECEHKHGEIEIGHTSGYLTVEDEGLLDELYAQKQIAEALGPRLSTLVASINASASPESVLQILRKQGYMPRLNRESQTEADGHHELVLRSTELSWLVGFLETALEKLGDRPADSLDEIQRILSRLKWGLRKVSDDHRHEAVERYRRAFHTLNKRAPADRGIHDLIHYPGQNPATTSEDIVSLVGYAIDHGLCIEIDYESDGQGSDARRIVEPVSEDHAMLYAYCRARKGDRVFRLKRIDFARLTGERAQHANGST